jgi:hypothetical protein
MRIGARACLEVAGYAAGGTSLLGIAFRRPKTDSAPHTSDCLLDQVLRQGDYGAITAARS